MISAASTRRTQARQLRMGCEGMQDVTVPVPHAHPCRYMKDATVTAWEYTADQLAVWQQAGAPSVTRCAGSCVTFPPILTF